MRRRRLEPYALPLALSARKDACAREAGTLPAYLLFGRGRCTWLLGVLVLVAASALVLVLPPAAVLVVALLVAALVFGPFVALLVLLITDRTQCRRLEPGYLVYVFLALQTAHAHTFFAIEALAPGSFVVGCVAPCTGFTFVRLFYLATMTFTSVGYGDVVPLTLAGTLAAVLAAWTPVFFLGVVFDRIVAARADAADDDD